MFTILSDREILCWHCAIFQTTVNDILRYNNIADANRIYVGETLAIPAGTSQSPRTHIVRPGESLWYISKMYNMTVEDLMNKTISAIPMFSIRDKY